MAPETRKYAWVGVTIVLVTIASSCALVELGDGPTDSGAGDASAATDGAPAESSADAAKADGGTPADPDGGDPQDTGVAGDSGGPTDSGPAADVQPQPGCNDGIKNGNETDVDCGGSCATKCAGGKSCAVAGDCVSGTCAASNRCAHLITVGPNGNRVFSPSTLAIKAGDSVKFFWGSGGHNVVGGSNCNAAGGWCSPSDTNCANANTSNQNATYVHTFAAAGSYPFFCAPHCNQMTGTITAQ